MQLRADAAAAEPQVGHLQRGYELPRRLEERGERQPVALVIVPSFLEARRRPERHVSVDRFAEMRAEAVRMRQRIDQRADKAALRRHELRVLTATWIDAEGFAAESGRDLVRVQSRRVHHA